MSNQAVSVNKRHNLLIEFANQDLVSAFSDRDCGNMSLVYGDVKDSLINRQEFLKGLGIDYQDLVCAKQIHSSNIKSVGLADRGKGALTQDSALDATDALITNEKGLPIVIFTADCLSIFLYDPQRKAIGLVHAGWRSSKDMIVTKTINLMQDEFNVKPGNLLAGFGPAIRQCCCQVGEEFKNFFPGCVEARSNSFYLDLVGANRRQLIGLGVREANIFDPDICTYCRSDEFCSYRKEGQLSGRMMSVMMLK